MCEPQGGAVADGLQASSAVLLCNEPSTPEDRNVTKVLDFFGIAWKTVEVRNGGVQDPKGSYVILSSADRMATAIQDTQNSAKALPSWLEQASSVFVYGFRNDDPSTKLIRFVTGDSEAKVRPIRTPETMISITGECPKVCGPCRACGSALHDTCPGVSATLGWR